MAPSVRRTHAVALGVPTAQGTTMRFRASRTRDFSASVKFPKPKYNPCSGPFSTNPDRPDWLLALVIEQSDARGQLNLQEADQCIPCDVFLLREA